MRHVHPVSRRPSIAQLPGVSEPGVDPFESLILITLTVFFSEFTNFPDIISQLQKFYAKN